METTADDTATHDLALFKSYYVVWKPVAPVFTPRTTTSFKSYYVVWKPEIEVPSNHTHRV